MTEKFEIRELDDMTDQFNWRSIAHAMNDYGGTFEDVTRIMREEEICWSFKQELNNG